jgi:nicotinate-nucleotide pyrophosphorylase (carboxylating)
MWSQQTIQLIHAACDEDLAQAGDITSPLVHEPNVEVVGQVVPRKAGVICGLTLGPEICAVFGGRLAQPLEFSPASCGDSLCEDGQAIKAGESVATVCGPKAAVLAVERTLLNFLGRMSGVATLTHQYVEAARKANPNVQILDTRKTIPGWRELDKYAVRRGGGTNHRMGLYDAVLIKDNHLAGIPVERLARTLTEMLRHIPGRSAGTDSEPRSVSERTQTEPGARATGPSEPQSVSKARKAEPGAQVTGPVSRADSARRDRDASGGPNPPYETPKFVEFEVDNLEQLAEVCKVPGVDVVLLDNFSPDDLRKAVAYRDAQGLRGKLALEASGKVTLENVADIATTGVDRISVGALTHSATSLDIGLDL